MERDGEGGAAAREEAATAAGARASNNNGAPTAAPASSNRKSGGGGGGWAAPLTRLVATPLYRAPEVCLGRVEQYSSAIDMWSLG